MSETPRVLALVGDESGCSLWRVWQPYAELARRGYVAEWCYLDDMPKVFNQIALGVYNAVVMPRLFWRGWASSGQQWIDRLHAAGLAVIYEVDDDLFSPQIVGRQHATTEPDKSLEQLEVDRRYRIAAVRRCDGVTVTNELLARIVKQYVDTAVCVVPNYIDVRWWRSSLRDVRRLVPPLAIGWAGGARYEEDLEPVAEAWHNIARRYPHVTFVVQGYMADTLVDAVGVDRCRRLPWAYVEPRGSGIASDYPIAMRNIDIGCASVSNVHFNHCKTPIKLWEYTLAGAASVVSPTLYGAVATDGQDALVAETAAEWTDALERLVLEPDLRRRLWRNQRRRIAEQHTLEHNAEMWLGAWQVIIDDYRHRDYWRRAWAPAV